MRSPRKLLTFHTDPSTIAPPRVPTLVHAFQGFVDAGGGVRQAADHIRETCTTELVATFDSDELLDYRARRPRMTFSSDHFSAVESSRLEVNRVVDAEGRDFFPLDGPEPDYQWNRRRRSICWSMSSAHLTWWDSPPFPGAAHASDRHHGARKRRSLDRGRSAVLKSVFPGTWVRYSNSTSASAACHRSG